jgi:hypothetical protein
MWAWTIHIVCLLALIAAEASSALSQGYILVLTGSMCPRQVRAQAMICDIPDYLCLTSGKCPGLLETAAHKCHNLANGW